MLEGISGRFDCGFLCDKTIYSHNKIVTPWWAGELGSDEYSFVVFMEGKMELIVDDRHMHNGNGSRTAPQVDPNDKLSPETTTIVSSSTITQNVTTISETAVPPETQISGENSNTSQMELKVNLMVQILNTSVMQFQIGEKNHVAITLMRPQQQIKTNLLTTQQQQRTIMRPKWPRNQTISVPQLINKSQL